MSGWKGIGSGSLRSDSPDPSAATGDGEALCRYCSEECWNLPLVPWTSLRRAMMHCAVFSTSQR